jgi:hypothetical protein
VGYNINLWLDSGGALQKKFSGALADEAYPERLSCAKPKRTVAARWAAVEAVAAALLERGFLLPMDLRRIIINSR